MELTSASLLRRLRQPDREAAWERFVELYAPLIYYWGRQQGLDATDASDLVQDVMAILVQKLPEFEYDPSKRFRGWLRTVTINASRNLHRRQTARPVASLDETIDVLPLQEDVDGLAESDYQSYVVKRALQLMQAEFQPQTWQACWEHVAEGRRAAEVAAEMGITPNAVYIAKSRVMRRLREELAGLLEGM